MKVFILGASGFIGLPAAQALVRAGHIVYGQTRSAEKAKLLGSEEIIPIVADPDSVDWPSFVAQIDVVVDAIGGSANISKLANEMLHSVVSACATSRPTGSSKLTYIYTSGTWVHGNSRTDILSDTTPVTSSVELVKWRAIQEQNVLTEARLNGIVVRPSMVFGRSGSITAIFFKEAEDAAKEQRAMVFAGTPGGRFSLIHTDDLADFYVRLAEKALICGGKVFDVSNGFSESVEDVFARIGELVGITKGLTYREPSNLFEDAVASTALLRPYLARSLLDWYPKKMGLVDGLKVYYASYKALSGRFP